MTRIPGRRAPSAPLLVLLATLILLLFPQRTGFAQAVDGIWTSPAELAALPTSGEAWEALLAKAREPVESPDVSDQDDPDNVRVLARALVWARTGDPLLRQQVIDACRAVIGTQHALRHRAQCGDVKSGTPVIPGSAD